MTANAFPKLLCDPKHSKRLEMFQDHPANTGAVEFFMEISSLKNGFSVNLREYVELKSPCSAMQR